MNKKVQEKVEKLIEELELNCTIEEFKNKVVWWNISVYQTLSENFIREFQDKVDWKIISIFQELSEDFIREFQDKVNWEEISCCQKFSYQFLLEFKDEIDWNLAKNNILKILKELDTREIKNG